MNILKRLACAGVVGAGMVAGAPEADAGTFYFGIGSSRPYYGGYGYGGYGGGGYGYGGYGGYGGGHRYYQPHYGYGHGHGHRVWHDTSHYDYHPGGFAPHGDHYHYIPGHYHWHQDGHWH